MAPAASRGYGSGMPTEPLALLRPGARSGGLVAPARKALACGVRRPVVAAAVALALIALPRSAHAQDSTRARGTWVGVGAIGRTAMFMDTTTIERDGPIRRVWLESVDPEPTTLVVGSDTTRFDTVVALHVLDCRARTDAVATARYYLAGASVAPPRAADTTPQRLRPGTFMAAVANDLCPAVPPVTPARR